jgi:hypothetical protein
MKQHEKTKKHVKNSYLYSLKYPNDVIIVAHDSNEILAVVSNNNINANTKDNFDNKMVAQETGNAQKENTHNIEICQNDGKKPTKKVYHSCKCGKQFSHSSSLSRHKQSCKCTQETQVVSKDHFIEKITSLEKELLEMKKLLSQSHQLEQNNLNQNKNGTIGNNNSIGNTISDNNIITDNSTKMITNNNNKTVNVITYLNNNYNEAQPLKMLESDDVTRLLTYAELGKHSLEYVIAFQQEKYLLDEFLGEFILKEFKKSDAKKQQIWISDIPRLKFIVRGALNQDESVWHPDKKGIVLTKNIITPMLNDIFILMENYVAVCKTNIKNAEFDYQRENIHKQSENALSVIYEINQKILHRKILLYIAPYFQLEIE